MTQRSTQNLIEAVAAGDTAKVKELVQGGADVDAKDEDGFTALIEASREGHLDVVQCLVGELGADVNAADENGWTALMRAAKNGHIAIVRYLAGERGADVNAADKCRQTALMWAASNGHLDVVQYLAADCGADANAMNEDNGTSLMCASSNGHAEIVRYLAGECGADVNAVKHSGETALMVAADNGHLEAIRFLTGECGADVNVTNQDGETALMWAADEGHIEVVRYLAGECGADVNATNEDRWTALMEAAQNGHDAVVQYLAGECDADVNAMDEDGHTALMVAADSGHTQVVQYLAGEGGANVNAMTSFGWTALVWAASAGHIEVVRYLAGECGADVNAVKRSGDTALMVAADNGHLEVIQYLAGEGGADVNATNEDGETALMRGTRKGHTEVVRYLVEECSADVSATNKDGKTAFRLAAERGYQEIERFLTPFLPSPQRRINGTYQRTASSSEDSSSGNIPPTEVALTDFVKTGNVGGEFRAKWLDADAAVKLFLPDASHSSFKDEERLWQQLRHPNVIKMYGACSAGPHLQFFVCEYASNGSLIEHVTSTSTGKRTMWKFLHEAALGLEYLHERGIVHGDLRCSNILIGSDGLSKLSSFGLSGSTSLATSSIGSMRWQSPEVLQGMPLSFASDVYSLGMCILEAATGKVPWGSESDDNARDAKTEWTPETDETMWWAPDCPLGDVRNLVWRMCSQDPNKRASISSAVIELSRLALQEISSNPEPERQRAVDLDNNNGGKVLKEWMDLQERMQKCSNMQHRQAFDELKRLYERLRNNAPDSTLLAQFYALLTDFEAAITMSADQALASQLSATSSTFNSFYTFHQRIESLWAALGASSNSTQEREARWEKQRSELFVSGVSDVYRLLSELDSTEEKAAFLVTLEAEVANTQAKYTLEQVEVMKKALEVIRSKIDTESVSDLVPDWFIPWYELIVDKGKCLGAGGYGSVHRAKWLDSEVVVKQVILPGTVGGELISVPSVGESWLSAENQPLLSAPTNSIKNAEALAMFRREVDIWFGFSHPHVIRLFGACHVGRPFFVCEYATNGTLVSYLKDHPDQLWSKLHEAALGVQYLHARGVVHGDLKGNNIVIGSDLKAKVTDFGLSSFSGDGAEARISAASHWVAPECFVGDNARPTFASDVYSLGMCIVEALRVAEGVEFCLPWGRLDNAAVRGNAKRGELPLKPAICKDNEWELVTRMCKLESEKRIKISTVVDELAELAHGTGKSKVEPDSVSVSLDSAPDVVSAAREILGGLEDSHSELVMYVELWDRLEQVHGLIDGKHSGKYRTVFSSLLGDAHAVTKKLQDTNRSLIAVAETTMRCYALRRRLDKLLDALFVARITGSEDADSSQD